MYNKNECPPIGKDLCCNEGPDVGNSSANRDFEIISRIDIKKLRQQILVV